MNMSFSLILRKLLTLLSFGTALMMGQCSWAELLVDRSIVIFEDGQTREDVKVLNNSPEDKLYVSVEGYRVVDPGTEDEIYEPLKDNLQPSFVATPGKLVVQPDSSNIVRLLSLAPAADEERIYRINFLPIARPLALDEIEPGGEKGVKPALEILLAYQVLAIVLPVDPAPSVDMKRTGKSVVFSNAGNANYLLTNGQQCDPDDQEVCSGLPNKRIYPGNTFNVALPYDGPFSYTVRSYDGNMSKQFE